MNREIKFRAYGSEYMSNPFTLYDIQRKKVEFTEEVIIMQYTGHKDRNEIEVYEGDIVKVGGLVEAVEIIDGILCCYSHEIYGKRDSISVDDENDITVCDSEYFKPYKVIGNIHQNPELLNG